jgi:hypothetical protein
MPSKQASSEDPPGPLLAMDLDQVFIVPAKAVEAPINSCRAVFACPSRANIRRAVCHSR